MIQLYVTVWILDPTLNRCCYILKYYTFLETTSSSRDNVKVPLLLFKIKSSLPGVETSFTYMFTSSAIASVAVSQPNLFHGALTHNNPKARSLLNRSNCCLILTKQHSPQLCATNSVFCYLQDTSKLLEDNYICMFLQFLSNSSLLHHFIKFQVLASAHLVVPTEEAFQVWDVIKRHPEVPTHADYSENRKQAAQCVQWYLTVAFSHADYTESRK